MQDDGRLVDVGGRALFARISGRGPTVVLNSGAGREGVGSWGTIEPSVSEFATVITYDRAGLGHSPAPPAPPTALDMAKDLRGLLLALEIPRPVLLVGLSMSALMVQLYACVYPEDVHGILLLDPTPDESLAGFLNHPPAVQESMRSAMLANAKKAGMNDAALQELHSIFESCEQVRRAVVDDKRMPDIEFVVVTASIPSDVGGRIGKANLGQAHQRMADRVPRRRHLFAEKSSHQTIISADAELIIDVIRSMLSPDSPRKH
jgi:pimeloyl-ACP methyl ester carboxylesterase